MNHRETIALLHDYGNDDLDAASRTAVEAHLAGCEDCMELAKVYRELADAATSESTHPSAEDVVAYAMHRDDLADARRSALRSHLAQCEQCSAELQHVRTVETAAGAGRRRPESGWRLKEIGPAGWLAAAALLVAAVLVYPSYLGLVRLPAVSDERGMTAFDGPVDFFVLTPAVRGEEARSRVEIRPGQGFVVLAFELLVPQAVPANETLRFRLSRDRGPMIWSHESSAGDIRDAVAARGMVTLAIPTDGLEAGPHQLTVSLVDRPVEPLAILPFDVLDLP